AGAVPQSGLLPLACLQQCSAVLSTPCAGASLPPVRGPSYCAGKKRCCGARIRPISPWLVSLRRLHYTRNRMYHAAEVFCFCAQLFLARVGDGVIASAPVVL